METVYPAYIEAGYAVSEFLEYSLDELIDMINQFRKKQDREEQLHKRELKERISINTLLAANIAEYVTGNKVTQPQHAFPELYKEEIAMDEVWQLEVQKQNMIEFAERHNKNRRDKHG